MTIPTRYSSSLDSRLSYSRMERRFIRGARKVLGSSGPLDTLSLIHQVSLLLREDFTALAPRLTPSLDTSCPEFAQWRAEIRQAILEAVTPAKAITVTDSDAEKEPTNDQP